MAKYKKPTIFEPRFPQKYLGEGPAITRSSWETEFMHYCDETPDVLQWKSEPEKIPYHDPLTNKQKIYIPDFLIVMIDAAGNTIAKLIEIKPAKEQLSSHAKSASDVALQARNAAKWQAAMQWCARRNIEFAVLNETNIFSGYETKIETTYAHNNLTLPNNIKRVDKKILHPKVFAEKYGKAPVAVIKTTRTKKVNKVLNTKSVKRIKSI